MWKPVYDLTHGSVTCHGKSVEDGPVFREFLQGPVAARLSDAEASEQFDELLSGLNLTGMGKESLHEVLVAEIPEKRDWAAGEALAETLLEAEHQVVFPWNNERDKRTPRASLPGADIVGFQRTEDGHRFALGEVKSSSSTDAPPKVMNGRAGINQQLEKLARDLSVLNQLFRWIFVRVKDTHFASAFTTAFERFLNSGKQEVALFGVLIRDCASNPKDLDSRGKALCALLKPPTTCKLLALYLPIPISDLPQAILPTATQ